MLFVILFCFFFFKQKTAYEMRISDWSSDVCSSDLTDPDRVDEVFLDRAVAKASERLAVLGGEEPLDDAPLVEPQAVRKLVAALGDIYDTVVIAMPTRLAVAQPELLSVAHEIVIVSSEERRVGKAGGSTWRSRGST